MIFLFPSDYFNPKVADPEFQEQVACLHQAGFTTSFISLESLAANSAKIVNPPNPGASVAYRGWMLSSIDYERLVAIVEKAGARVLTSKSEYLATHHLPNWYPIIADLTPETRIYSLDTDLEKELYDLDWDKFFIKDYVKSLKTSIGSKIDKPSDIADVIAQMQKFRGTIEGGICVRQVEDFIPETERRYFIVRGKLFAASIDDEISVVVQECAKRINSPFFSVDVVERREGILRVVEIGDGQVSDLVGWTAERFAQLWV